MLVVRVTIVAMRLMCVQFLFIAMLTWIIPAAALAQQSADLLDQKLNATALIDKEMAGLDTLGTHDLDEVIRFSVDDGKIEPITLLPVTGPLFRTITLRGLPGSAMVAVWSNETIHTADGKHFLQFHYRDLTVPNTVDVYTEITSTPDSVMVSQAADLEDGGTWQVTLIQAADAGPQAVSFYVQIDNGKSARRFTASSLAQLTVDHPDLVTVYLRPIFRQFNQEQVVFAADSKMAYQVLADLWPGDPAAAAAVEKISSAADAAVAGLAADSYSQREAALAQLRGLGEPAALYLLNHAEKHLSPEQNTRIELFLAPYLPLSDDEAHRLKTDPDFLLDCLFCPDGAIRRMAANQLREVFGKTVELNPEISGAKLDEIVTQLRMSLVHPATRPAARHSSPEPSGDR